MRLQEPHGAFHPQQVEEVELDDERELRPGFAMRAQVVTNAPHPIGYVARRLHRGPTRGGGPAFPIFQTQCAAASRANTVHTERRPMLLTCLWNAGRSGAFNAL